MYFYVIVVVVSCSCFGDIHTFKRM